MILHLCFFLQDGNGGGFCQRFAPAWMEAANQMSERKVFTDADGKQGTVKFLRINCVAFGDACRRAQVSAFPSVRLYKRDGSFEAFRGRRTLEGIAGFLEGALGASRGSMLMSQQHHTMFSEGCEVSGTLEVPRVPGHFYLQAQAIADQSVNPALTNVSHLVKRLSFGDLDPTVVRVQGKIPQDMVKLLNPLDGRKFVVERFHEAPQHNLEAVSTYASSSDPAWNAGNNVWYQMTHTDRVRRLRKDVRGLAPQARFSYDLSPTSAVVGPRPRRWYAFLTSLFAILGGTCTTVELCSEGVVCVGTAVKEAMGKTA
ncbi:unnamed protein product [Prorocentrum cordatum]|uniref:Thioredoxin domain-containing protein n=1 Tax=Prorocentrum cordatum TaxID=2364126 RepID=A0ABN9RQX9_9DINO|nr:unnamed protein product [Polarella glacialis]